MDTALEIEQNKENNRVKDDLNIRIEKAIKDISERKGYIRYYTSKKTISSEGGNYLGVLNEINIHGETSDGKKDETNIFVKQIIPNVDNINIISVSEIYSMEIFIYKELKNIFTEIQDKANIPKEKRFKLTKMYEGIDSGALLLENMTKKGFKTYDRMSVLNLNYAKISVDHLAKLHALSFVIEKEMPKYYENKIKSLKQPMVFDTKTKVFMNNIYELSTKKIRPELKTKLDKWWKIASPNYLKYYEGTILNVKCLCHGDFKMNNVMYKEIDGEIVEVIAVDYQLAHYGPPILDLMYFLYMGTDQEFRRKHLHHVKDLYYDSLKTYLENFDVLVENIYPRKEFEKDFEISLDYALMICIWILPLVMTAQGEDFDLADYEAGHFTLKFEDAYYERLQDIVDDCFKIDLY